MLSLASDYGNEVAEILHTLFARPKRPFENALGKFPSIVRGFARLQFLRKQFFRTRPADGGHRFDLKVARII